MRTRMLISMALMAVTAACGGAPRAAGPSPVAAPASVAPAAAASGPRPVPAWIAPELVGTLIVLDGGYPKRWEGGPIRDCMDASIDADLAATIADAVAEGQALTGIPETTSGPCGIEWSYDGSWDGVSTTHSQTEVDGTARAVVHAHVFLRHRDVATIRHERGHAIGLGHSPRRLDLMNAGPSVDDFSADERAVIAWIFGR